MKWSTWICHLQPAIRTSRALTYPLMRFADRYRQVLTYSPPIFVTHVPRLTFDLVQAADRVQRLFG